MLSGDVNILLTGVTGLIGGELMRGLLARNVRRVWTLVRADGVSMARARLRERMASSGAGPELDGSADLALPGNLDADGLGLEPTMWESCRRDVDVIIHCAAETSFIREESCRRTNVVGMGNLLRFARSCPKNPLIVYVGTAASYGMIGHRCLGEEAGQNPHAVHYNEYTRSKAEAERMLFHAGVPHLIVRPSIVFSAGLCDRKFARSILWFVPLLEAFEALPIDPEARIDAVPVRFVVDSILRLLSSQSRRYNCYHISAGPQAAVTTGQLSEFTDRFYQRSRALELIRPKDWTEATHRRFVRTRLQRRAFARLRYYLPFLNMDVVYDNTRLRADVGGCGSHVEPLTNYLGELLGFITFEEALLESKDP